MKKQKATQHLPYTIYLFDTKYPLRHLAADIGALDSGRPVNETIFCVARPFPVAAFPMDQGYRKCKHEKKTTGKIEKEKQSAH